MIRAFNPRLVWTALREAAPGVTPHRVTRRDLLALVVVLLAGAVMRFANPEIMDWSKDHSDQAMLMLDMYAGKGVPLVGQASSARIPFSPFFVYPLIIPYAVTENPIIATSFIAALNLVGVGLLWYLVFRYFGPTAAFVAALAYAMNPWAVGFSRSIWSGDHRAPLFILSMLLGLMGFVEGKRWAQILCLPVMAVGLQVHFAAWTLAPMFLWLVWIGRKKTSWRALAISFALAFLTVLPFLVGITQTLTDDSSLVTSFQGQRRELTLRDLAKPYGQIAWMTTGLGSEQYQARENAAEMVAQAGMPTFLWIIQGVAALVGLAALWRYGPGQMAVTFTLWALWQLLVFTVPFVDVFPHYFIPTLPALCLLVGVGFKGIVDALSPRLPAAQPAAFALFGVIFATQGIYQLSTLQYIRTHYTPSQFGFGILVSDVMKVGDALQPYDDVVVISSSDWLDFSRTGSWVLAPFVYHSAECVRDVQTGANAALFPDGPFAAVFAPRAPENALLDALYRTDAPTDIALRPGEGIYSIHALDAARAWDGPALADIAARFENGVQLTGYALADDRVYLRWSLPEKTKVSYTYTVEWLAADGSALERIETAFWPSINWCAGDSLILWADAPAPDGAASLRVSLLPAGRAVPVGVVEGDSDDTGGVTIPIET